AGGVIDRIGVDPHALLGGFDPAQLAGSQVATLDHHLAAQLGAVDPDRVVRPVPDLGVGLGGGLDVGADSAVVDQIHRSLQAGVDQVRRAELADVVGQPQGGAHLLGDLHRLGRAGEHPAAL